MTHSEVANLVLGMGRASASLRVLNKHARRKIIAGSFGVFKNICLTDSSVTFCISPNLCADGSSRMK